MDPIIQFFSKEILPNDKSEAEKIRRKAPRFWLSEDQKLYKRSFSGPYLLCIHPEALELILEELHEGICGSHTRGRSLTHRTITQGQGSQFRTVLASTAGIYRSGQCTGIDNPLFHTGKNTSRTGRVLVVSAKSGCFGR